MREAPHLEGPAVDCRFLLDAGAPAAVFEDALRADARAARLSPAFRTYYRLRSLIPLPVRQLLQRYRPVKQLPDWYLPRQFASALAGAVEAAWDNGIPTIHPWPDGATFAFVPTHDVETADGMRNIVRIANLEEELGFRSSWNIVPHKYPVDRGLLRDLQNRGFEIGIHGYNHDGRLFTSRAVFDCRVPAIKAALEEYGAVGFRAPMVHRHLEWLQSLDIEYDASYFDADPYQAMAGGVGGVWPFIAGRFVELPYTLPQDHTLFVALGERDARIWYDKLDFVAKLSGMALFITHPDYLDSGYRVDAYRRLLARAQELDGMWHALPQQVAAWWRERDQSRMRRQSSGEWQIEGPAARRARAATLKVVRGELAWYDLPTATAAFDTVESHARA
jgi:peptidoglycan/xylan/chitin deacetylase (PgdA/CDA1 family)